LGVGDLHEADRQETENSKTHDGPPPALSVLVI
jgi:hypothetical protein